MYWSHECSAEWLLARKQYITASEIARIVPVTDTGRKRSSQQIAESMRNIYVSKLTQGVNTHSDGAMARGHVLEPYAVKEIPNMYHWDDALLVNDKYPGLAYSPDALSIEQLSSEVTVNVSALPHIECIGEIKSYSPERHVSLGITELKQLPERWQLVVAMMITEAEDGRLIGFNPEMNEDLQVIIRYFDFDFWKEEMDMVEETLLKYNEFVAAWNKDNHSFHSHKAKTSYEQICKEYLEAQQSTINPRM